jgi:hypothetical protein
MNEAFKILNETYAKYRTRAGIYNLKKYSARISR